MYITKITSQQKDPSRKNIYVDGEFRVGVSAETLLRFGLRTGDEIGADKLRLIEAAEEVVGAKKAALRYLSYRPRTVREVRDKLREKEFGDEEIQKTIQQLEDSKLLNDLEFARMYVRDAVLRKPIGKLALKQKMILLGLERKLIDRVLDEMSQETDQEDAARRAAENFLAKGKHVRDKQDGLQLRNRLANFLAQRGFTWDIISKVIKVALSDNAMEDEP